jgi:hypothetical protein
MRLKIPLHFQDRMQDRELSFDDVKKAIRNPDSKEVVFGGRIRVTKTIGDRKIRVVYCVEGFRDTSGQYVLITAYYL